jgi:hypothetical protein
MSWGISTIPEMAVKKPDGSLDLATGGLWNTKRRKGAKDTKGEASFSCLSGQFASFVIQTPLQLKRNTSHGYAPVSWIESFWRRCWLPSFRFF